MTANRIGKETVTELAKHKVPLTPDNYQETFCKIAKRHGISFDECEGFKKFVTKLNPTIQSDLKKYKFYTTNELLTYLVATLNRVTSNGEGKLSLTLITVVKQLLKVISLLHNRDARELVSVSLERIEHLADQKSFEMIRDKWSEFLSNYDDSFLDKIDPYIVTKSRDYDVVVDELIKNIQNHDNSDLFEPLSKIILSSLTPSIATKQDDELASITYQLKTSPKLLAKKEVQKELHSFIKKRVKQDKVEVEERLKSLDEILGSVSKKLINFIDKSSIHNDKIRVIKDELIALDHTKHTFKMTKERLITLADSLEFEATTLKKSVKSDDDEVKKLKLKVKKLEEALKKVKQESKKDFLTNLTNKRGLDEDLNRVEKSFERYGIDYSVAFFDIDKFKMINDTFGHEAGDVILKHTGEILKKLKRDTDIIGRYGGEEFLAILPNTSQSGAVVFANKVRSEIQNFDFLYKGEKIAVTISGGVADRKLYRSQKELIEVADSGLYRAKEAGRNRIFPENG